MIFESPKAQEKYVSLERAAEVLCLSDSQIQQYLVTGQLLAAIVYHKPSDYRDSKEITLKDGSFGTHIKTNRTAFKIASLDHKYHEAMYVHPEDAGRVLLNKVPNRDILIGRLFRDPELQPKLGMALIGDSAISVQKNQLIILNEELARFAKKAKIKIRKRSAKELSLPPRPWYDRPLGRTALAVAGIFLASIIVMVVRGEL